jgi:hypothetical protein
MHKPQQVSSSNGTHVDYLLIAILAFTVAMIAYHPYFFGDELGALNVSAFNGNQFWATYRDLNSYKPRLIYNAIWALFGSIGATRLMAMAVYAAGLALCMGLVFRLASKAASRGTAWLAAVILLSSRFGGMLFYDYISGIVEVWSLAFLLVALTVLFDRERRNLAPSWTRVGGALLALVAAVFVHERYAVAAMAVGGVVFAEGGLAVRRHGPDRGKLFMQAVLLAALPLLLFALANKVASAMPLTTGTAGQQIEIGWGMVRSAMIYLSNVFLGTNFGKGYFVGGLTQEDPRAPYIFGTIIVVSLGAWVLPLWARDRWRIDPAWTPVLLLTMLMLIAVASLPGPDQQQARWMLPVQALLVLLVLAVYRGTGRNTILGMMLFTNVFYLTCGSYRMIANISASFVARDIAIMLNTAPPGKRGVIVQGPEPDTSWIIAGGPYIHNDGTSAAVFCSLNIYSGSCVDPMSSRARAHLDRYDFGLLALPPLQPGHPLYKVLSIDTVKMLLAPDTLSAHAGAPIGVGDAWKGWRWNKVPQIDAEGVMLDPGLNGNVPIPAQQLDGKVLAYRAQTDGALVPMNLQINWYDRESGFINAAGDVVQVGPQAQSFILAIPPPPGAEVGFVYASLQAGATERVRLKSIRLIDWADLSPRIAEPAVPPVRTNDPEEMPAKH